MGQHCQQCCQKLDDIFSVIEEIKTPESIKKYLSPTWDAKSLPLTTSNGPFSTMTLVQSDNYLVAGCSSCYQGLIPTQSTGGCSEPCFFCSWLCYTSSSGQGQQSIWGQKGIVKLMLLHIHGDINIEATSVSNIIPAAPSKGMQVVLNQPWAAWASQFADLVWMTLELAKQQDFTSISSTQISIWVMSKILASHMLQGNFSTEKVTSLRNQGQFSGAICFSPSEE